LLHLFLIRGRLRSRSGFIPQNRIANMTVNAPAMTKISPMGMSVWFLDLWFLDSGPWIAINFFIYVLYYNFERTTAPFHEVHAVLA